MTLDINEIAQNSGFDTEAQRPTIIKVIGVGGGGNNAVNHMYKQQIEGVSFAVLNTDWQALKASPVPCKVLVGDGLGAGGKPEVGQDKAESDHEKIEELFDEDTKMVFITAGMGGGTGTGAGPVVARLAHERGLLTVGIITIPFLFEGMKKITKALDGADEMAKYVDALLVINNEQLVNIYPDLTWLNAFSKADDILTVAARSISELVAYHGQWNLDFEDVNTTLRNGGPAIISTGIGKGENRITQAFENALTSPLLKKHDVYSAQRMLVNICYNPDNEDTLTMGETREISEFMNKFSRDQDLIVGQTIDPTLESEVKVTIMASGFDMEIDTPDSTHVIAHNPERDKHARIASAYGQGVPDQLQRLKDEKQFVILRPEDIDNDDIIEALTSEPAYGRNSSVKARINDLRNGLRPSRDDKETQQRVPKPSDPASTRTLTF